MYRFPGAGRRLAQLVALILVIFTGSLSVSGAHRDSTAFAATPAAQLIYVDGAQGTDSATCGANPGPAACQTIGYALANRVAAGGTVSVAAGTYRETITLKPGVKVQGAGAETTIIDGNGTGPVVTADGAAIGDTVVLSGFTVTGGQAASGAGITIRNGAAPLIENNTIRNNTADFGGAMHIDASAPTVRDNTIRDNTATSNAGGIYVWQGAPAISGNTIEGNSSGWGGGLFVNGSAGTISGNIIQENTATAGGGGIQVYGLATCAISGNTIESNSASPTEPMGGGGLNIDVAASPVLSANVVRDNTGLAGAGINLGGTGSGTLTAHGNVICGNSGYQFYNETPQSVDLTGNWWGTNNPGSNEIHGLANYDPWIAMSAYAIPARVTVPGTVTVRAVLHGDGYPAPDGTPIAWRTTLGTLHTSASSTAGGVAQTVLSSASAGQAVVTATDPCGFSVETAVWFLGSVRVYMPLLPAGS